MPMVTTRAGQVAFQETGSGPPLLLLHATLHDRHDFDVIVPELSKHHRVIALDWPGHGDSGLVQAGTVLGAPLLADALEDFVEALDLGNFSVIGSSVGGYAAAHFAALHPDRVEALVLVNCGGFTRMNLMARCFCAAMGVPWLNRLVMPSFIRSYMKAQSENDRAVTNRALKRACSVEGTMTAAALWRSFADPRHDLTRLAPLIKARTLIIWGDWDTAIPLRDGHRANRLISQSSLHRMPTGHVPFSSRPDDFLCLVLPWISKSHH